MTTREDGLKAIENTGKSREQAEAFLDILGSAFRRRGWVDGKPLSKEDIGSKLDIFLNKDVR